MYGVAMLCSVSLYFISCFMWMFGVFSVGGEGFGYMVEWQFLSLCGVDWTLPLIIDSTSLIFSCFVCFISGSVALFSMSYMETEAFIKRFMYLIMAFVGSMNLLVFVPSLITVLLGWDGLGIVSFALVIYYQNKKSLAAGMLTVLANRIGDALLIVSICLFVNWGEWRFGYEVLGDYSKVVCLLVIVGGMTKSAQIPFSAWLPAAMAAPTPVSALVHSSTLVTAGIYLIIRFYGSLVYNSEVLWFLSKIGGLTLLMAGLSACYEVDLKKIVALSTLSQLGLMMFTVGIGLPFIAVFHLFTHALFKALLFLCVGSVIHSSVDNQDGRILGGLWINLPFSSSCLVLSSVALCGMPFLSGFYSKDLILEGAFTGFGGVFEMMVVLAGAGMSLVYSVRILLVSVFGQSYSGSFCYYGVESTYVLVSIILLSLGAIIGGWTLQSVWMEVSSGFLVGVFGKSLISLITVGGLVYLVLMNLIAGLYKKKVVNLMSWFMSSMWFMGLVSGSYFAGVGLKVGGFIYSSLDLGWMEVLGGQGVMNVLDYGVVTSYYMQKGSLLTFVRLFVVFFVLFILSFLFFNM